jgi:hypothetical protein
LSPFKDHVEGLSVSGRYTYAIHGKVRTQHSEQLGLFDRILRNIQQIGLIREFEQSSGIYGSIMPLSADEPIDGCLDLLPYHPPLTYFSLPKVSRAEQRADLWKMAMLKFCFV